MSAPRIAPAAVLPASSRSAERPINATVSSTTPDVPKDLERLPVAGTLAWSTGVGVGLGALLLRSRGAGLSIGALGGGAWKGGAIAAAVGAALIGLDVLTRGAVKQQLDIVSLDRRAQLGFVLSHPAKPWIGPMGLGVAAQSRAAQAANFGPAEPLDGAQDAFRHAYAASLFSLRAMRDHGMPPDQAHSLAIAAGEANEIDGQDHNDRHSRAMDIANNLAGTRIVGDGMAGQGERADETGFITEPQLERRILAALANGELTVVDRSMSLPAPRPTVPPDVPRPQR